MKYLKINKDKWMHSSIKRELNLEEEAIWLNFLMLAGDDHLTGHFKFFDLKHIAQEVKTSEDKIKIAMKKFIEYKKIEILEDKEGCTYFKIVKFAEHNPEYAKKIEEISKSIGGRDITKEVYTQLLNETEDLLGEK